MSLERGVGLEFEPGSSDSTKVKALKKVECIHSEEIHCFSGFCFMWAWTLLLFRLHCKIF